MDEQPNGNGNRIDRIVRRREAAELLGISERTLHRMSLPIIRISQRAVGYRESVIAAQIANREAVDDKAIRSGPRRAATL
jgi:predicted DNA-binding transcriptional regulator AlpA